MKYALSALAAACAMLVTPALVGDANAQNFDNGPVWDLGQIQTKDGHFDDYMKWLSTQWKAQEEALKKAGIIVDYKVYIVQNQRQGEPDIILAQEYKNMAAFDTPVSQQYAMQAKISGSVAKANQQQAARGTIRTVMGDMLIREAVLK
jgi:hypothetical protein